MRSKDYEENYAAFRRMEPSIKSSYPHGHFVAFVGGQLAADAEDFDDLHVKLKNADHDPWQAFIVQAGYDYPEYAVIFLG